MIIMQWSYTSYDLANKKVFSLPDIVTAPGIKTLSKLLESNFRKQYGVKPGESLASAGLFENIIKPNDNFYVTERGLMFTYNPYEIGPFAMGTIPIFVPFTSFQSDLQPKFAAVFR